MLGSRRRSASLWITFVVACGAAAADAAPAVEDPVLRTTQTVLDNGLTVLTLEDRTTPVVTLQIWARVGSKDESRYTGLAHLFEHMMFKGSKNVAPEMHARWIEARGGRVNAYTTNDVTVYFEDVIPETLPLAIELEAERLANLDISESTLESERQVVLEERRMRTEDDPEGRAIEALMSLVFTAHPYRWPVIGWRSDLEAVSVEACRDFFRTYYAANNLVVVIAGDFDTESTLARVERTFGRLAAAREIPRNPTVEPEPRGERRAVVEFDVRSPIVALAWRAPQAGHPDGEALDVAAQILSGGRSSRLYQRVVDREQLALFAQGGYWELQHPGLFYAYAAVRPGASVARVEASLLDEIRRLRREPVSAKELETAKRQLEVSLVDGLATTRALAARIGRDYVTFGRIRTLEERLAALEAVGPEDVRRVAQEYFADSKRSVVQVVPPVASGDPERKR